MRSFEWEKGLDKENVSKKQKGKGRKMEKMRTRKRSKRNLQSEKQFGVRTVKVNRRMTSTPRKRTRRQTRKH